VDSEEFVKIRVYQYAAAFTAVGHCTALVDHVTALCVSVDLADLLFAYRE
jgi:hypothetical protein